MKTSILDVSKEMYEHKTCRGNRPRKVCDSSPHDMRNFNLVTLPRGRKAKRCWVMHRLVSNIWRIGNTSGWGTLLSFKEMVENAALNKNQHRSGIIRYMNVDTGVIVPAELL